MSIVVQRLTDIRAPVGVVVAFSFLRKVRIDGAQEAGEELPGDQDEDSPSANPKHDEPNDEEEDEEIKNFKRFANSQQRESMYSDYASADIDEDDDYEPPSPQANEKHQRSSVFSNYASNDIDEDDFVPPKPQEPYERQQQRSSVFSDYASNDIDEDDFVPPPPNPETSKPTASAQKPMSTPNVETSASSAPPRPSRVWEIDPMVEVVTLRAENEDLQAEIQRLQSVISTLTKERDSSSQEAHEYRLKYEAAESERVEFLKQLSEVEVECQQLEKREKDALQLLEKVHNLILLS